MVGGKAYFQTTAGCCVAVKAEVQSAEVQVQLRLVIVIGCASELRRFDRYVDRIVSFSEAQRG